MEICKLYINIRSYICQYVSHCTQQVPQESITDHTFITKQARRGFKSNMFSKTGSQPRIKLCCILMNNKRLLTISTTVPIKIKIHCMCSWTINWPKRILTRSKQTRDSRNGMQFANSSVNYLWYIDIQERAWDLDNLAAIFMVFLSFPGTCQSKWSNRTHIPPLLGIHNLLLLFFSSLVKRLIHCHEIVKYQVNSEEGRSMTVTGQSMWQVQL